MISVLVGKRAKKADELKWEEMTSEEVLTLASTPALFGGARTFVLSGVFYGERGEEFLGLAKALGESPHAVVFEEEKLFKSERDALARAGAKIEEAKPEKKEYKFDPFNLSAALAARDKKGLWLGLYQALRAGGKPEAVAGLLAWKARSIGDKKLSRELTFLYHDSHRGAGDLELLLERFALKL